MVWIRVEDNFDEHPKFARVGPLGIALWMAGLGYCNRNLTDGFIPWSVAQRLMAWEFLDPEATERGHKRYRVTYSTGRLGDNVTSDFVIHLLVMATLWVEVEGGYRVHDYDQYQPTREEVEAERISKAAAGRAGGQASAKARAIARAQANGAAHAAARGQPRAQAESKQNPTPVPGPGPVNSVSNYLDTPYPQNSNGPDRTSRVKRPSRVDPDQYVPFSATGEIIERP